MAISEALRVAHCLSLRGVADAEAIASATGLPPEKIDEQVGVLQQEGTITWRLGPIFGWQLTAPGRERTCRDVSKAIDTAQRDAIAQCYAHFMSLNDALLLTCATWQMRRAAKPLSPGNVAGQSDEDSSASKDSCAIIGRLRSIDVAFQPTVAVLGEVVALLDQYPRRLGSAMARVDAGQTQWIASPFVDSYHTIWFELHEDLLSILGIQRSS